MPPDKAEDPLGAQQDSQLSLYPRRNAEKDKKMVDLEKQLYWRPGRYWKGYFPERQIEAPLTARHAGNFYAKRPRKTAITHSRRFS
jgi:hypothetical protein